MAAIYSDLMMQSLRHVTRHLMLWTLKQMFSDVHVQSTLQVSLSLLFYSRWRLAWLKKHKTTVWMGLKFFSSPRLTYIPNTLSYQIQSAVFDFRHFCLGTRRSYFLPVGCPRVHCMTFLLWLISRYELHFALRPRACRTWLFGQKKKKKLKSKMPVSAGHVLQDWRLQKNG